MELPGDIRDNQYMVDTLWAISNSLNETVCVGNLLESKAGSSFVSNIQHSPKSQWACLFCSGNCVKYSSLTSDPCVMAPHELFKEYISLTWRLKIPQVPTLLLEPICELTLCLIGSSDLPQIFIKKAEWRSPPLSDTSVPPSVKLSWPEAPVLLIRSPPRHHSTAVWLDLTTARLIPSETETHAGRQSCDESWRVCLYVYIQCEAAMLKTLETVGMRAPPHIWWSNCGFRLRGLCLCARPDLSSHTAPRPSYEHLVSVLKCLLGVPPPSVNYLP